MKKNELIFLEQAFADLNFYLPYDLNIEDYPIILLIELFAKFKKLKEELVTLQKEFEAFKLAR